MSVASVNCKEFASDISPEKEGSGVWDYIASLFGWLATHYQLDDLSGLSIYKSGGHLVNEGTISAVFALTLDYRSITNRGYLGSSQGTVTIRADRLLLCPGASLEGMRVHFDVHRIEIDGVDILAGEALKVTSCEEIILRGLSPDSPTWQLLEHLPSGCIKTITTI